MVGVTKIIDEVPDGRCRRDGVVDNIFCVEKIAADCRNYQKLECDPSRHHYI